MKLIHGDCLEEMKNLDNESIDMILTDLPYGTTQNKWDSPIDLNKLWEQYKRLIKRRGVIALFAQTPFDKVLGASNLPMLKYEWIWEKPNATGFLNSNFAPLKAHENILIFSFSGGGFTKHPENNMIYHPQFTEGKPYVANHNGHSKNYGYTPGAVTENTGFRYPRDVIVFGKDKVKYHPTQKPTALCEYLIKTYTDGGMTVLDSTMGSGTTGVAAVRTGRDFIGIELNEEYFNVAKERIENECNNQTNSNP